MTEQDSIRSQDIVEAVDDVAQAIRSGCRHLGTADAATPMGALEAHGAMTLEAAEKIASAISDVASAISDLADAVREVPVPPEHDKVVDAIADLADAVRGDPGRSSIPIE